MGGKGLGPWEGGGGGGGDAYGQAWFDEAGVNQVGQAAARTARRELDG